MTLLYADARFLDHDTGQHPECAERLRVVYEHLEGTGLVDRCRRVEWPVATVEQLGRIHTADHLAHVERVAARGGGRLDPDTVMSAASNSVAKLASGAAVDATRRVLAGEDSNALCLVRPPGHHALADHAMGFCLYNNIAVAAQAAIQECGLERVLIVDWDVHHGNGTQASFYDDPRVGFFSIHRWPFYPGTGAADETGHGEGLGTVRNLPTEFGTPPSEYIERFTAELGDFAGRIKPQLLLVSAGFDSHREDPIGSLGLEVEDFVELTRVVRNVADSHAGGRVVSLLEGGYNPPRLAECVAVHLEGLLSADH